MEFFSGYIIIEIGIVVHKTGEVSWDIASEQMPCFLSISISSEALAVCLKLSSSNRNYSYIIYAFIVDILLDCGRARTGWTNISTATESWRSNTCCRFLHRQQPRIVEKGPGICAGEIRRKARASQRFNRGFNALDWIMFFSAKFVILCLFIGCAHW